MKSTPSGTARSPRRCVTRAAADSRSLRSMFDSLRLVGGTNHSSDRTSSSTSLHCKSLRAYAVTANERELETGDDSPSGSAEASRHRIVGARAEHQPLVRLAEAEPSVQRVGVAGAQVPGQVSLRAAVDRLPDHLDAQAAAAVFREHEDIAEERVRRPVARHPAEADHLATPVHTDHPRRLADEPFDGLARTPLRPVRLLAQVAVHHVHVDARDVVVQLVAVREPTPHQQVDPSRRCCRAGSRVRTSRSSARSRSAANTPSPSSGASVITLPHGSTIMLWPYDRRFDPSCPYAPHWPGATTKHWFSIARARSSTSQCAVPVVCWNCAGTHSTSAPSTMRPRYSSGNRRS